jgi:hypothetical protein
MRFILAALFCKPSLCESSAPLGLTNVLSGALFATNATAFKYHDNDVNFSYASRASGDYALQGASLVVEGLSITSGQDPKTKNRVGDVKLWEQGRLRFTVGRKGSGGVANW